MYKTSDASCSTQDWVQLNFDTIPTSVFERLFRDVPEDLVRVRPDAGECKTCDGCGRIGDGGEAFDGSDDLSDECPDCDGAGEVPADDDDERELCAWPAAHGWMFVCEDRSEYREALLASGFVVYTDESREGDFSDLLICGIDGGGYSFDGAHWIPLRAQLAKASADHFGEAFPTGLARLLLSEAKQQGEVRRVVDITGDPMGDLL